MIEVKDVVRQIRFKNSDLDEVKFSDHDVFMALNEALRYIGQSHALINSDYLEKIRWYDEQEMNLHVISSNASNGTNFPLHRFNRHGVKLPRDFSVLVGVVDMHEIPLKPIDTLRTPRGREYKIVGNTLYTGVPAFKLAYRKSLGNVESMEDSIELPDFLTDVVVKIAGMVLNQAETDIMLDAIDSSVKALVPRRRYHGAEMKMPFKV